MRSESLGSSALGPGCLDRSRAFGLEVEDGLSGTFPSAAASRAGCLSGRRTPRTDYEPLHASSRDREPGIRSAVEGNRF